MKVSTWFERDRANVTVLSGDKREREIVSWWDEEVYDLVESGYLDPRDWSGSAIEYVKEHGLRSPDSKTYRLVKGNIYPATRVLGEWEY